MTATLDTSTVTGMNLSAAGMVNARTEPIYLRTGDYEITARQIVYCLASHLANFGDNFDAKDVDAPLWAIDVHMRFDGDLQGWTRGRTPNQVALILARAEQIAVAYFGHRFPALPW